MIGRQWAIYVSMAWLHRVTWTDVHAWTQEVLASVYVGNTYHVALDSPFAHPKAYESPAELAGLYTFCGQHNVLSAQVSKWCVGAASIVGYPGGTVPYKSVPVPLVGLDGAHN